MKSYMITGSSSTWRIDGRTAGAAWERVPMNGRLGSRAGAVLAAALDRLIPGDEFGPCASGAGVGRSIEGMLARADPSLGAEWRSSLEQLDDLARARGGTGFAEL